MWQQNLFNNLLVLIILGAIVLVAYCKITKKTVKEIIMELKD